MISTTRASVPWGSVHGLCIFLALFSHRIRLVRRTRVTHVGTPAVERDGAWWRVGIQLARCGQHRCQAVRPRSGLKRDLERSRGAVECHRHTVAPKLATLPGDSRLRSRIPRTPPPGLTRAVRLDGLAAQRWAHQHSPEGMRHVQASPVLKQHAGDSVPPLLLRRTSCIAATYAKLPPVQLREADRVCSAELIG